ncbi:NitT/TauT family transport system ATP-binding protein [Roseovarius tolerans]|uniref:NitT/TauT family transport system ATP-binding protein n=1 Tax=Roseovarius tolerans TaxID=74031 RepID=A0A1H8IFU1_9RHOB|nr:ABC transporter ATP-binding protein [Roseovarius tolerans]SEN67076.1 NitT/TauT family transport system ATP-binding protein [Roseovarius tolerans]
MNTNTILTVENVSKTFSAKSGPVEALRDVSFAVEKNELCVLLGPSGCGKSTLLNIVAGLEYPSAGRMLLDGVEVHGPGRERGMVFQGYTSFPWLTVLQNVEYGMKLNGVPKAERRERASHYVDLVHLGKFRNAYPKTLSGGMKQRVAIARTLANAPEILLMDEPFGALDAETRWHMQEMLLEILDTTHTTILLVTHDIQEAIFLADRIVFLSSHPGRLKTILDLKFKQGKRPNSKEELIQMEGYLDCEQQIVALMRSEAGIND